jgi:iron complex outermembrane receptor protein
MLAIIRRARARPLVWTLLWVAAATAAAGDDVIDEVVVTARKVAEPLSSVPLAIQVISRQEIERSGIDGLVSLAGQVPGLYVEPMWGGTNASPTMRGQAHAGDVGAETVGIFIDGILQANDAGDDAAMFDLDRIEVIEGPQSALYGDSTFAGAINLVTRRPTEKWEQEVRAGVGSDAYHSLFGAVSGPLGPPGLLGRMSVSWRDFDGTGINLANPRNNLGGYRKWGTALSLEYAPYGAWRVTGNIRLSQEQLEHPAQSTLGGPEYNCGARDPTTGYWSFYCGDIPRTRRFDISPGIPDSTTRTLQGSLHLEWHADAWSLDNLATYYRSASVAYRDWDGTSAGELLGVCTVGLNCDPVGGVAQPVTRLESVNEVLRTSTTIEHLTEELRVRRRTGRLDWMVGAQEVLAREHDGDGLGAGPVDLRANERLTALLPATPGLVGPISVLNNAIVADANRIADTEFIDNNTNLTEFFGAVDYRLLPRINLHAELRQGLGAFGVSTPRLSVDWRVVQSSLLWLSVARGGAAGGSNNDPKLMASEQNYGAESEVTYELGYHGALWSERAKLMAVAFYNDWRNAQIGGPANTPGSTDYIIRNIKGMTTPGFELSVDLKIAAHWSTMLGYVYDNPRFKSGSEDIGGISFCGLSAGNTTSNFCTVGPSRVLTQGQLPLVPYVDGNVLQRAPRNQWTSALQFESSPAASGLSWFVRAGVNYQGPVFVRPIDGAYDGERTLVDARIGLARGAWSLELWGSNLTDVSYIRAVASRPALYFPTTQRPQDLIFGDARRFGLDGNWRF